MTARPTNYSGIVFWEVVHTFYEKNPNDRYCTFNADPKIQKVREKFADKVKAD